MPLDVSGVLIVLMMSGKKLSELRFVFILYSQDTFATTYGYVLCLPIGQANFALFQFQNGNKPKKNDLIRMHLLFLTGFFCEEINYRLLKCFLGTFLSNAIFLLLISVVNPSYSSFLADANNKFGNQPF